MVGQFPDTHSLKAFLSTVQTRTRSGTNAELASPNTSSWPMILKLCTELGPYFINMPTKNGSERCIGR